MLFDVKTEDFGSVLVLHVSGDLSIGYGDRRLRSTVETRLDEGTVRLVVDATQLTSCDSTGIGELVALQFHCYRRGCILVFAGLTCHIESVLRTTHLISEYDLHESIAEAVSHVSTMSFEEFMAHRGPA